MNKSVMNIVGWVLVVAGLLYAYEAMTGTNLVMSMLGASLSTLVGIIVGVSALAAAYGMLMMKPGKKK